jgi:putative ABC transport system permease protein
MPLAEVVRVALRALARHRMRTLLAMLGVSIGVGAFICSVAVGEGASRQVQEQILSLGNNMIWIEAGNRNVNGVRTGSHGTRSLTEADMRAIRQDIVLVMNVSPNVDTRTTVVYQNQNWFTQIRGVSPEYLAVRRWQITEGTSFSQEDVDYAGKVCVLGQTVVTNLFGSDDPVGRTIRVQKIPCQVLGVLALKGQSPTGQDQDDVVLMPFTTVQKKVMGIFWVDDIMCSAVSPTAVAAAEVEIAALLRERHHISGGQEDDFNLRHPAELARAGAESQRIMTLLLASIASVALAVAGVGIMNIMLVSVAQRTREIGIRLAVGARGRDIRAQFLVEAVTLALIGGGIGIAFGLVGSSSIAYFAGWPTVIQIDTIAMAVGFAAAVGIFFGFYPARQASLLDPIEALRR